ncbi:MAG: VanZ family protein [Deltaproteobacteria bacterium]|nr:VanZ family protein [Deltaproteobacteria bacterium]
MRSARIFWLLIGWLFVGLVIFISLTPSPPKVIPFPLQDKVLHFSNYLFIMFWFAVGCTTKKMKTWFLIGFILMGISLEFLQGLVPTRTFDFHDMLANTAGVLAGFVLAATRFGNFFQTSLQK